MKSRPFSGLVPSLVLALSAGAALAAPPGVRYVRADGPPGGNGLSWATAYNDLRQALIDAGASGGSITELWVKGGTYLPAPAGSTDVNRNFPLSPNLGVYGGFAGFETQRDQRNPASQITILNGTLGTTNVASVVNAGVLTDATAVLDGFRVMHTSAYAGYGVTAIGSPTIRNCMFTHNATGVRAIGPPAISDCVIIDNRSPYSGTAKSVSPGVICISGSAASFTDCQISSNFTGASATTPDARSGPGAITADSCALSLTRCQITGNTAGPGSFFICGGGHPSGLTDGGHGGGLYATSAVVMLDSCSLISNTAGKGSPGAICGGGFGNPFPGSDGGHGGGIYSINSTLLAVNCTFARNQAGRGGRGASASGFGAQGGDGGIGGGLYTSGGDVNLVNCTLADNTPGAAGLGGSSPPGLPGTPGNTSGIRGDAAARVENCIFWNDGLNEIVGAAGAYNDVRGGYFGLGTIDRDPLFIDGPNGDYRLRPTSPCIDAGNSSPSTGPLPATDHDGLTRRVDFTAVPDTGVGPPVVDIGAFEAQNPCPIDYTGDGLVDFSDYLEFLNLFDAQNPLADLNHDGFIDFADYLEFLTLFDSGC